MDPSFWHDRWERDEIHFHQSRPNAYLTRYLGQLGVAPGQAVFVPLCGKALDMHYLHEQGLSVCGVELSSIAVEAFFAEHEITYCKSSEPPFDVWRSAQIEIYCGDFFDLQPEPLAKVAAVYDRASLIALPAVQRRRYAEHLLNVVPVDAPVLLLTVDYPQEQMQGPPFSVGEREVMSLFGGTHDVRLLESKSVLEHEPRFKARGVTSFVAHAFLLTRRR